MTKGKYYSLIISEFLKLNGDISLTPILKDNSAIVAVLDSNNKITALTYNNIRKELLRETKVISTLSAPRLIKTRSKDLNYPTIKRASNSEIEKVYKVLFDKLPKQWVTFRNEYHLVAYPGDITPIWDIMLIKTFTKDNKEIIRLLIN